MTACFYERLSRDDNLEGESYSISNQKRLLEEYARRNGFPRPTHFTDDGISGTRFDRPGFTAMMEELEKGHAATIFVKDVSCLGRNYIEVGKLTEDFFLEHDIRLVAVSDGVDDNELTPIRNLFKSMHHLGTSC